MACLQGDGSESEVIVVIHSELFCRLKFESIEKGPEIFIQQPITEYRILKIATNEGMGTIIALGRYSDNNNIILLEIKARPPSARAMVQEVAELRGLSDVNRSNLRIYRDGNATVALVTAVTSAQQCSVYRVVSDEHA